MNALSRLDFVARSVKKVVAATTSILNKLRMDITPDDDMFKPPEAVRGMTELNRDAFSKEITVRAVLVPLELMHKFQKMFKKDIVRRRGAKIPADNEDTTRKAKFVLVKPDFSFNNLSPEKRTFVTNTGFEPKFHRKKLHISYENYKHQEILGGVLPEGMDATSGFARIGHIAHVNLLDHQVPYKKVIGQVLLDTHKALRTVVNKSSVIDNTFRNFEMEVIAGEEDFVTKVIEHGHTFEFDFSKVFWNSKLQTEHNRLLNIIPKASVVFDVFAGVGPFSIPLAKKGCQVFANDLNQESYKWLVHNTKLNKTKLEAFNVDGRRFIKDCLGKYMRSTDADKSGCVYVVMNLPALAISFLDAFQGLLCSDADTSLKLENGANVGTQFPDISVFCYSFSSAEDKMGDIHTRAECSLGAALPEGHEIREVRSVAPGKDMLCLAFKVPREVLVKDFGKEITQNEEYEEPDEKRQKMSSDS